VTRPCNGIWLRGPEWIAQRLDRPRVELLLLIGRQYRVQRIQPLDRETVCVRAIRVVVGDRALSPPP